VILVLATLVFAQVQASPTLTLKQIQDLAVSKSAQIKSATAFSKSESTRAEGSGLLPNPFARFEYGYANFGGVAGPTYDSTIGQSIPFPGKLSAKKRIQELKAQIAQVSETETKLLVQHAVTLTAIRLANLNEISKHELERRRRFQLMHDYLRSHPQVSPSQKIEAALIENQIRILEKGMIELSFEKDAAESELKFFTQLPEAPTLEYRWISQVQLPKREELESLLAEHNPELRKKEFELEHSHETVSLAKLDPWPDFGLTASYRLETPVPANNFYFGGITIALPFWDHGQYSIPAAQASVDTEVESRENIRARLKSDFEQAWKRVQASQKELDLFPLKLVDSSEKKFAEAETEFRKGRISVSVLLATDAQIHETLDSVYNSQFKLAQDLSRLYLLVGKEITL